MIEGLKDKRAVVAGAGKSGISAIRLLLTCGAKPVLYDDKENLDIEAVYQKVGSRDFRICCHTLPETVLNQTDVLVMSPGIPVDTDFVAMFTEKGIPVWGEIELAYRCSKGTIIAITGTNGKTTTTALTGKIMGDYFKSSFTVGNIGIPFTDVATRTVDESVIVAEISSFQLETAVAFQPKVSAILNITPDHLNRHHTMDCYVEVKESVTKNQERDDVCVLNYMDPNTRAFGDICNCLVVWFSSDEQPANGYWYDGEIIWSVTNGVKKRLLAMEDTRLLGRHNAENIMAAIAMATAMKVPFEQILQSVKEFEAVEHRIEYVATKKNVKYYNDSKGTNTDAAIKAIQAMNRPTVLIGGGYDKQSSYDDWIDAFQGKVTTLVLLGQTAGKIAECAKKHGFENIVMVSSMEEAVAKCAALAREGDTVLLSPACASWGMFHDYEERGRIFKDLVRKLPD